MDHDQGGIIAVNDQRLEESDFVEWMTNNIVGRMRFAFPIAALGSSAVLVLALVSVLAGLRPVATPLVVAMVACLVVSCVVRYYIPGRIGKLRYRQYTLTHRSGRQSELLFFGDHWEMRQDGTTINSFAYSEVLEATVTSHLGILTLQHRVQCAMRRDGFSRGSLEEVLQHLPAASTR